MGDVSAFRGMVDLAAEALGGEAIAASDDFFAEKENLLKASDPIFIPDRYTERGKWMDGWESRRRRAPGHDWCTVKLGVPGRLSGANINTAHFLGNHPPFASIDARGEDGTWREVLPVTPLQRGAHNLAAISDGDRVVTHVRLRIYPAGGVARLRIFGTPAPSPLSGEQDLAAIARGGRALACSDMFFSPMNNLLMPGEPADMGGGWETRRSRPPGEDWVILALGQSGVLSRLEIGTLNFKGNPPERCAVDALCWPGAPAPLLITCPDWETILEASPLRPDSQHTFPLGESGPWTHLRLRILPDGGISRLRAFGTPAPPSPDDALLRTANAASLEDFVRCCGSQRWAAGMVAAQPYGSRAHLLGHAEQLWWRLDEADWLEAFAHHPRIGADPAALRARFASTAHWAAGEQSGVHGASEATLAALLEGNKTYEQQYGHIFIVCASGLSAEQMLARLQARLGRTPSVELARAAAEQAKITRLRLQKLEPTP